MPLHICFAHGKESGPWGNKGQLLSKIANDRGHEYSALNYLSADDPDNPEARVRMLYDYLNEMNIPQKELVLVGSSMGGYVVTRASQKFPAAGLFLMAPAFGLEKYPMQWPELNATHKFIMHGLFDSVIPWMNSNQVSQDADCQIHLLADDHRLGDSQNFIEEDFIAFLKPLEDAL